MKVNFNLRSAAKSLPPQSIHIVVRFSKHKFVYATAFKVRPSNWDTDKQRVRNVIAEPQRDVINAYLVSIENAISVFYAQNIANKKDITPDSLRQYLDVFTNKKPKGEDVKETPKEPLKASLMAFIDEFIDNAPNRTNPKNGLLLAKTSIVKYTDARRYLAEFEKTRKKPLTFEDITFEFAKNFDTFLKAKNFMPNTIGKAFATLKVFINEAATQGLPINTFVISKVLKSQKEDVENIYLNVKELQALKDFDFSDNPRLERVRDFFLIGCWTGLRYSDFSNIKPENIKDGFIKMETSKTKTVVTIPIHPIVAAIIARYDGVLPPCVTNQRLNYYIKEAAQIAGLTERIEIHKTRGGKRESTIYEKWQLICTHTARRSFATNQTKIGMDSRLIKGFTGHKTDSAFSKYIKTTGEENAELARLFWEKKANENPSEQLRKVV